MPKQKKGQRENKMFKCCDCGKVFDEPRIYEEHHPYGMGYATETFSCCPYCGENYEEAKLCKSCNEYFLDCELEDGICEECREDEIED